MRVAQFRLYREAGAAWKNYSGTQSVNPKPLFLSWTLTKRGEVSLDSCPELTNLNPHGVSPFSLTGGLGVQPILLGSKLPSREGFWV